MAGLAVGPLTIPAGSSTSDVYVSSGNTRYAFMLDEGFAPGFVIVLVSVDGTNFSQMWGDFAYPTDQGAMAVPLNPNLAFFPYWRFQTRDRDFNEITRDADRAVTVCALP